MFDHRFALAVVFVGTAFAQSAGAATPQVQFSGCVAPGVEHGCTIVRSGQNVFNITAAKPLPDYKRGLGISGAGTKTSKMSYCMQGAVLENIKWMYTRQKCPVPSPTMAKRKH